MKNILVFPCGSEIALEIHRSLKHSTHFNLIGASSVDDHGKFIYENYIYGIPFLGQENFISEIKKIVKIQSIDAIYPAMDSAIVELKKHEMEIKCKVLSSSFETVEICLSKKMTYEKLKNIVSVPKLYKKDEIDKYPIFGKPEIGYGSRGTQKIENETMLKEYIQNYPDALLCEYLPGEEYTVDCFTNRYGNLLFHAPRIRSRIMNGISVHTMPCSGNSKEIASLVKSINEHINFRGAWFVQLKRNKKGELVLLEIASRFGGSSALFRAKGINFAGLTLFDAFDMDVVLQENNYDVELSRSLNTIFKMNITYTEVFCDFDDCLILNDNTVNKELVAFLYQCFNKNIKLTLLTKHKRNIHISLKRFRLDSIFDRIIHIQDNERKSDYIDNKDAIFIDDSFMERKNVFEKTGIPVFGLDMVEYLPAPIIVQEGVLKNE